MLNCFEDYEICIHISYHILDFIQQKKIKVTMEQPYVLPILYCQCHACWCTGDFRSQCISRHGIDLQSRNIPSLASEELKSILFLTDWGWVTHVCVSKLTIIVSDNDLSPGWHQTIIWTIAGILLIRTLEINCSEIFCKIHTFSFKKMHLKMSSVKWPQFCLGFNVLIWFLNPGISQVIQILMGYKK